jgi:hypothetical protein
MFVAQELTRVLEVVFLFCFAVFIEKPLCLLQLITLCSHTTEV